MSDSGFPYYPAYPAATATIGGSHTRRKRRTDRCGQGPPSSQQTRPCWLGRRLADARHRRARAQRRPRPFDSQTAPDDTPWEPLTDNAKRRRQRNKDKTLARDGDLRGNPAYRAGRDSVEIDQRLPLPVYAGTHRFGALKGAFGTTSRGVPIPWGDIPARPFLGLSEADCAEIKEPARDCLNETKRR